MNENPYVELREYLLKILQPDLDKRRLGQGSGRHALNSQRWIAAYAALPPQILQEQRQRMTRLGRNRGTTPYSRRVARKHVRMIDAEAKRRKALRPARKSGGG